MRYSSEGWCREQFGFLRRQFLQDGELPFTNVLCEERIAPALDAIEFAWKDRIYTPLVTLWVFLGRPDRIEPRRIKRRHKHYVPLSVPRAEAKRQILKGLAKN